jgi:Protein involved in biosynthesis of mitomycin antibiotics/polyketide fumonisin
MDLTQAQMEFYDENGYLLLPECFSTEEVEVLRNELPTVFGEDSPRRVIEKEGFIVRSVYGSHMANEIFRRLSRHPKLVNPARQILESGVYVYQFKINAKAAFGGDVWEWHQDYIFWHNEDGLPSPRVLTAAIFIDDVTEFNGPLFLIPGSHKWGIFDVPARGLNSNVKSGTPSVYQESPEWINNLTANLKYSLPKEIIARLVTERGIVAPKGPSGSVLFFHSNLAHGSPNNISPFDRVVTLISFNSTENIPVQSMMARPDFLVGRDYTPIDPMPEDVLFLPIDGQAAAAVPHLEKHVS